MSYETEIELIGFRCTRCGKIVYARVNSVGGVHCRCGTIYRIEDIPDEDIKDHIKATIEDIIDRYQLEYTY